MILKSPPYQAYWDLEKIDPYSIETERDKDNYYKTLLHGCKHCDRIEPSLGLMLLHKCLENGTHTSHISYTTTGTEEEYVSGFRLSKKGDNHFMNDLGR